MEKVRKYCAYIDVLGFKNILEDWNTAIRYYHEMQLLIDDIINYYQTVTSNLEKVFLQLPKSSLEYSIFSDTLILTSTKASSLLFACSDLQFLGFLRGYSFRGAISYGNHIEVWEKGKILVVSQALRDAYECERLAIFPRIVIDPRKLSMFNEDTGLTLHTKILAQSNDDLWFINPFYSRSNDHLKEARKRLMEELNQHMNDPTIRAKYQWLAHFFNFNIDHLCSVRKDSRMTRISVLPETEHPKFILHSYEGKTLKMMFQDFTTNSGIVNQSEKK